MNEKIIIEYKNKSYIVIKKNLESYDQFYNRAWLIAKDEPTSLDDYKTSLITNQKKINELYLGYEY
jgi:hypothetical protein|tara:strand:+ start:1089 stop:1286 length:198 start_codon:yes stop_codon:yes gene_type:complete